MTDPTSQLDSGTAEAAPRAQGAALSAMERCVLLAVLYAELFDFPLTASEIRDRGSEPIAPDSVETLIRALEGQFLARSGIWVTWIGRQELVEIRRQRTLSSQRLWQEAIGFGAWLRWVPFVRMVGVCGSLAADNAGEDGDVDLFCVTESDRLWIAHTGAMALRRIAAIIGRLSARLHGRRGRQRPAFCPNFFLTLSSLELSERNLYTAHEVTQVAPLWGSDAYRSFLAANAWALGFLPNRDDGGTPSARPAVSAAPTRPPPWPVRWVERALSGRVGSVLDGVMHRTLLVYYRWRLSSKGIERSEIEASYRRDRQRVVGGGFKGAVEDRFRALVAERLGDALPPSELERLFPAPAAEPGIDLYRRLFSARYGREGACGPDVSDG